MPKRILPSEAQQLIAEGWTYLDVRSIPEFEAGHPTGAYNVPLLHATGGRMVPNPDFEAIMAANFPKDARIVVGCKAGGRSLQAATLLEAAGYTNVVDMRGGYSGEADMFGRLAVPGWTACGLPVETSTTPGCAFSDLEKKR